MASIISAGTTSGTALNLSGDTSGNLAFQTGAGANTITVPNVTGTLLTNKTAGTVLQVVQATLTTEVSSTSSTYADTGLTATITPTSSTSKILVMVNHNACRKSGGGDTTLGFKLLRAGSIIVNIDQYVAWTGTVTSSAVGSSDLIYLDSPATTSATIYKTQLANLNAVGTVYLNVTNTFAPTSTITLMEIAA
jgi:hypothetical protein